MTTLRILALIVAVGFADRAPAQSEPFMGQTMTTAAGFCPAGWLDMKGQSLLIASNTALFQLIGTTYGGNGETTFALPLAKPLFTANGVPLRQCIAVEGIFPGQN